MPGAFGVVVFVLAAVAIVGWFAIGTEVNIRKGRQALRWLQEGLGLVGQKTTLRWLGSSVVELKIGKAYEPLRSVEVLVVLEPRDLPFLWWFFRARGRQDLLVVRGELRSLPRFELEVLHPDAWSTRPLARKLRNQLRVPVLLPPDSSLVAYAQGEAEGVWQLLELARPGGLSLVRLAIHNATPHLELQWKLAEVARLPSKRVFSALSQIARTI